MAKKKNKFINTVRVNGCFLLKKSLNEFNRLSECSWDDFDISLAEKQIPQTKSFDLKRNLFKVNLYPSDGQPSSCVSSWDITLLEGIPGKIRRCTIRHTVRTCEVRIFDAHISLSENKIVIWGVIADSRKDGEDFELVLEKPSYDVTSDRILEGSLKRGKRKKGVLFERTHEAILVC